MFGTTVRITHPDNKQLEVKVPKGTGSGARPIIVTRHAQIPMVEAQVI